MRTTSLRIDLPGVDATRAFLRIDDLRRFPLFAEDVRSVDVRQGSSDWTVRFRRGFLRWTEVDRVDAARLRLDFTQTEGDFEKFHGFWQVSPEPGGCAVAFEAHFDFGIDSMAGLLDPIAERVITRIVHAVLAGLSTMEEAA